ARQSAISALLASPVDMRAIVGGLDDICDVERIIARVAVGRCSPRDVAGLSQCLESLPALFDRLKKLPRFEDVAPELLMQQKFCEEQAAYLKSAILPEPAPHLREGGVVANGFDAELDRLRSLATNSQQWLA